MARLRQPTNTTDWKKVLIVLTDEERTRIKTVYDEIVPLKSVAKTRSDWNKFDEQSFEIIEITFPFENGGRMANLNYHQLIKLDKCLKKLCDGNFESIFSVDIDEETLMSKEEMTTHMDHVRTCRRAFDQRVKQKESNPFLTT